MVNFAEEDLVAGELAANGPDPLDGDVGVAGNYNVVTGIGDVLVVDKIAPVRKEVARGTRANA
jgi:hypothetical protein